MQVRAGQYSEDTVRVVVDIKSFDSYKVFSMSDPFRIIVDVWGDKSESSQEPKIVESEEPKEPAPNDNKSILDQAEKEEFAIKRSLKRSTKISAVTVVEDSLPTLEEPPSSAAPSDTSLAEEEAELSSKTSTKIATKSSSPLVKIESETDSKDAEHLPVKKSLKASTMILSDATRKLLRDSLAKQSETQSKERPEKENAQTQSKKESVKVASKDNSKKEPQVTTRVATKGTTRVVQQIAPGSNVDKIKASAIAKQLALGVKTIVIDPGHGGRDPGASGGCSGGVYEKDVVLTISKKLASKIKSRLDCNVILTRSSDTYLTLEERTAIANTKNADLFISMHCNASNDSRLMGIETYYLNLATDERAINVAARENATSRKNISDLSSILNDLMKNAKINESSRLAAVVQSNLYSGIAKRYSHTKNLGVKQAPFYVLLGASMPSILIEASFISNPEECRRLTNSTYQDVLCDAITDGIAKYIRDTNPQRF
ncbi:MAG: N-acetylmuramoyl-L-alanine amidase [Desulfamplus sp.]|nr:N-acetylmuramoyl-L-alanine amidase [Desulfamplus sp.]